MNKGEKWHLEPQAFSSISDGVAVAELARRPYLVVDANNDGFVYFEDCEYLFDEGIVTHFGRKL